MSAARLATFTVGGRTRYGAITGKGVVDLSARHGQWPTLREVIEAGALLRLAEEADTFAPDFNVEDIAYEIPIPSPEKIICVGVNYPDRNEEYKDGQAAPSNPSLFIRFPRSFVGHGASLV
ncbi:MAG: 2-hydroxyhepta-2,4-diene-1,7-dioate isomerase, partial [Mesorhizobium sp.]